MCRPQGRGLAVARARLHRRDSADERCVGGVVVVVVVVVAVVVCTRNK